MERGRGLLRITNDCNFRISRRVIHQKSTKIMAHQTSNGSATAFITSLTPEPEQVDIDQNKRSEEKAIARDIKEDEYGSLEEALTS